jgi:hypothetical protein
MSRHEATAVKLNQLASMLGDQSDPSRLILISKFLVDNLDDNEIELAIDQVLKRDFKIPAPVKFLEYAKGSDKDRAQESLERVMQAIKTCNDMEGVGARQMINDDAAWKVISSFGGWYNLLTAPNFSPFNFRAQFLNSYQSYDVGFQRKEIFALKASREVLLIEGVPDYGPHPSDDQKQNIFDRTKEMAKLKIAELLRKPTDDKLQ